MQRTTLRRIIMALLRRLPTLALAAVLTLALITPRLPIAGQTLPPDLPQQITVATSETPEQLQQLVAPIALYPDALVAQILAASTYPTEVVQADRWMQQHSNLQSEHLAAVVDQQSWDPSVKALTSFPSVLANMDNNLSWTEALGNAYFNQQQDVLDAIQLMRRRAEDAGNLQNTLHERVVNEGPTIIVEPAYPDVCYLPIYDPWIVYGAPVAVYPGYFYEPWYGPPFISFGPAIGLSFFGGFGWGWPAWGFNWGRRTVVFNHNPYVSHSRYFFHREPFTRARGDVAPRRSMPPARVYRHFNHRMAADPNGRAGNPWINRGQVGPRANLGPSPSVSDGSRPGRTNQGAVSSWGSGGRRPSFSGGGGFSGSVRSSGSRGDGGGGRHR